MRLSTTRAPSRAAAALVIVELCDDREKLVGDLANLERLVAGAPAATQPGLRERIAKISDLAAALQAVTGAAEEPTLHAAFFPDAPLADYLRGVVAWLQATLRALEDLTARLLRMRPDWASYRWRIEEAKNFHFDELRPRIVADLTALVVVAQTDPRRAAVLRDAVLRTFHAADELEETLDRRFA